MVEYKLDYISRLLQRTSSKRIEHYVISRIWHLLDDYDIKMTLQQYVSRNRIKYALTDVYFPQIGFHVEVNEPAHYESEERIERDLIRQNEIEAITGHQILVIDCNQNLEVIHRQIDQLVAKINLAIKEEIDKGNFRPWKPENEHNPCYWKEYGTIALSDEVAFHTIEDICSLFDADYRKTKRGFLRKGGIRSPNKPELFVWWPSEKPRSGWLNSFDEVAGTITETHSDEGKKRDHYNWHAQEVHTRIVFFHYKDILGRTTYRYVGVFVNDRERSTAEIGTVWTRVGEEFNLGTGEYH